MFQDKKILVLGMARSGYAASILLIKRGNTVILNDGGKKENQDEDKIKELEDLGVKTIFGSHPDDLLDESFDYIIKNPGINDNHKYVKKAKELNIPVINEVEMAYKLLPDDVTLIGITGTNGKTTTTTLTYEILKKEFNERVHLAGNIGYPLCSIIDDLKKDDIIVMEVSCQQSVNFVDFRPNISLITNFSPAHLDFFDNSYEKYKETKAKMFYNQTENDVAILNIDNLDVVNTLENIKPTIKYFSSKNMINGGYIKDDSLYYYSEKIIDTEDIKIPGVHNLENCLSAIMIAKELDVKNETIKEVLENFTGVEHRLEYVATVDGVRYYNDTEATNIKSTQIALSAFKEPTIIILGGLERGQNFEDLTPYMKNVKMIIGIGQCRNRVLDFGTKLNIETHIYEHMKDSFDNIKEKVEKGDIVLLSPASASWDQYKECEIRGQEFKDLVSALKK